MDLHRIILNIPDIIKKDNQKDKKENELTKQILVGISDTDRGISSKIMPKLFEKSITGSDTGTGLGLCITKNIVEAHGGNIWAFNNDIMIHSELNPSIAAVNLFLNSIRQ